MRTTVCLLTFNVIAIEEIVSLFCNIEVEKPSIPIGILSFIIQQPKSLTKYNEH